MKVIQEGYGLYVSLLNLAAGFCHIQKSPAAGAHLECRKKSKEASGVGCRMWSKRVVPGGLKQALWAFRRTWSMSDFTTVRRCSVRSLYLLCHKFPFL